VSILRSKDLVHLKVCDTKPEVFETAHIIYFTLSRHIDRVQDVDDCKYCII